MSDTLLTDMLTDAEQALCAVLPTSRRSTLRPAVVPDREETLDLRIELGRTRLDAEEAKRLHPGSVVPLHDMAGEPAAIYAGPRLVARGELLVYDGKIAVRLVEIME